MPAPQSPASVRPRLLAAEREEAKAVLSLFLRQKGLRSTLAARIVNKSDGFIEHLVSKLQIAYRSRYAEGFVAFTMVFCICMPSYWFWTFDNLFIFQEGS